MRFALASKSLREIADPTQQGSAPPSELKEKPTSQMQGRGHLLEAPGIEKWE
jgi:hypothetical protein